MRVRPTVLAVPGAVLGPWALKRMTRALESKGEFAVHMVDTRAWSLCLDDAAEVAAEALRMHKQPSTQVPVHIVTHGAGALVVRRAFQLLDWEGQNTRVVMLGPPNKGSRIARRAARSSLWRAAVGHGVVSELGALGSRHFAECGDPPASASVLVIAGVSSGLAPWIPLPAGFTRGIGQHDGAVTPEPAMSGRLDRLELENFKSYHGSHTIGPFRSFSCVCGPNGAGKSNVMDAICFVLGLSAKHMRGSALTDLIYNNSAVAASGDADSSGREGGEDRAVVRMVYVVGEEDEPQVAGGVSPGEELVFSRSVTRSGGGEFRVQGRVVTAAQYKRTLRSVNIDTDSREFLVFQGDVTSLARRSPRELMDYLEVVAGSARLRPAFEAAEAEKAKAQDESIFAQRQAKGARLEVRTARAQAKEAEEFLAVEAEAGELRTLLALWRLWQADRDIDLATAARGAAEETIAKAEDAEAEQDAAIQAAQKATRAAAKRLAESEKAADAVREAGQGAVTTREEAEARLATEEHRAAQADKAAAVHRQRAERLGKAEEEHAKQVRSVRERMGEPEDADEAGGSSSSSSSSSSGAQTPAGSRRKARTGASAAGAAGSAASAAAAAAAGGDAASRSRLGASLTKGSALTSPAVRLEGRQQREAYATLRLEARQRTAEKRAKLEALRRAAEAAEADARQLRGDVSQASKEGESLEAQVEEARRLVAEQGEALEATVKDRRARERRVQAAKEEVEGALRRQAELATELREVRSELSAAEASRSESRAERGAAEAVAALQERFGAAVHGRVVDLVTPARPEHALAVEVGLGRHCDAVVVDTESTARECVQTLRDMQARGCLFLPLDSIRPRPVPPEVERVAAGGVYRLLSDAVRCEAAVRPAVTMACGATVLADTLDSAMRLRYSEGVVCRVVAVDGSLLSKNGNMSGGAKDALRRAPRRKASEAALREATARRDRLLAEHETCRRVTGRSEGGGEGPGAAVQQRLLDLEVPLANVLRAEAVIKADLTACTRRLEALSAQLATLRASTADRGAPLRAAEEAAAAARARVAELEAEITAAEDKVYAPLLAELGIASITEYEQGALAEEEKSLALRREQLAQVRALEAARDRQRQLRLAALASAEEAEAKAAAARKRADALRKAAAVAAEAAADADGAQQRAAEAVDEARAAAAAAKEAVSAAKALRRKAGAARAEAERALGSAQAEVDRQAFRRHDVLLKARVEGVSLPTLDGGDAMAGEPQGRGQSRRGSGSSSSRRRGRASDAAGADEGSGGEETQRDDGTDDDDGGEGGGGAVRRSRGGGRSSRGSGSAAAAAGGSVAESESGAQPLGARATVTSSVRAQEAEALTRLDYSALEERLGLEQGSAPDRDALRRAAEMESRLAEVAEQLEAAAPNLRATDQLDTAQRRLREVDRRLAETNAAAERAEDRFAEIAQDRAERFGECVRHVQREIDLCFKGLTRSTKHPQGGTASLHLFDEHSPFDGGGVNFSATYPGKTMRSLGQLSGGEKTVAALALLFAIHSFRRAPFFVMDEVDAALDSSNVHKVSHYVRQRATHRDPALRVQCLVVSLKEAFFHKASSLVGVCKDLRAESLTSRSMTLELDGFGAGAGAGVEAPGSAAPASAGGRRARSRTGGAASGTPHSAARGGGAPATPMAGVTPSGGRAPGSAAGASTAPPSTGLTSLAGTRRKGGRALSRRIAVAAPDLDGARGDDGDDDAGPGSPSSDDAGADADDASPGKASPPRRHGRRKRARD
ncbi:hypothetical protein FNF29_02809 [Cafeteria roenbergensis]|uniref:SMC hinge domain-containing protein n=1 Tax=Cafeteria roenbergensis TaxID=33653 RepID=A0A5A8CNT6_CAFRO|nr:hypothetical protein FNF29_02809 [Cafeteria roenbergensis]|eukprot:KAA0153820.1 hypothetical protein FNF29_02809 [Cafeteria roenbergensis]